MHKLLIYFFISILFIQSGEAMPIPKKIKEMTLNIHMGDKSSHIKINKNREYSVDIQGSVKKGELSKKNFEYITKKAFLVIKEKSNNMEYCMRSYIQLSALENEKYHQRLSCIGSKSQVSKKMLDLLNIVALL